MKSKTPTEARKDFYQLLKRVNSDHKPVYIEGKNDERYILRLQAQWTKLENEKMIVVVIQI